jgi:diguanylate cyclase (GGDEF)-like protein
VKILLADDDPVSLKILAKLTEELGHEPVTATDGRAAMEMLESGAAEMAVLDWMMPGLSGPEICRRLRRDETSLTYIIILTAMDGSEDVISALEGGANDFVTKPFNRGELRARIRVGVRTVNLETELRRLNERLAEMARTDSMTGLLNHTAILDELDAELRRASRKHTPTSVLMFDLDRFKRVNDTLGHQAGDTVLKRFSALIDRESRGYDRTGRYGGEEFLLLLPETGAGECRSIAERIRAAVEEMDLEDVEEGLQVTTSVGGSTCDGTDIDGSRLITLADDCLYRAKEEGRNRVCIDSGGD